MGGVESGMMMSGLLGSSMGDDLGGTMGGGWRMPEAPVLQMSLHALYLHQLHHRKRLRGCFY